MNRLLIPPTAWQTLIEFYRAACDGASRWLNPPTRLTLRDNGATQLPFFARQRTVPEFFCMNYILELLVMVRYSINKAISSRR